MSRIHRFLSGLLLGVAIACRAADTNPPASENREPPDEPTTPQNDARLAELIAENKASAAAVIDLAVERFKLNQERGENWILTLQDADIEVRKYTDGKFTVVALPLDVSGVNAGLCRFVFAYNHMVIRAADQKVQAGALQEAETTYRLLLKHDPNSYYTNALHLRLRYLEEVRTNRNPKLLETKLKELDPKYDIFSFISDMGVRLPWS